MPIVKIIRKVTLTGLFIEREERGGCNQLIVRL